jgi:uncharacterized membrane-anchored protein
VQASRRKVYAKIGVSSIVCSCLLWAAVLFIVPFYPASISHKALITTGLVVISEVLFWLGIMLLGKELAHRYRRKLNPYYWWQKFTRRK